MLGRIFERFLSFLVRRGIFGRDGDGDGEDKERAGRGLFM